MREDLINYILNLTPEQVDKIFNRLDELRELAKESEAA